MEEENIIEQSQSTAIARQMEAAMFDEVYARHWKPLYRSALRILKDEQAAEDIIQDTFVRLWEDWETMPHTNIKGWLFTTSYRLVLKRLKRSKESESIEQVTFSEPLAPGADELLRAQQLQLQINACVDNLPEQCQRVYTMSRHDNMSIRHIASQLGISTKTVEYHVSTALRRIRQSIGSIILLLFLFI